MEAIGHDLDAIDARVEAQLEPFQAPHRLLMQIPGVDWVTAAYIIAEIGTDMDVFATARRLAAWAGVGPWRRSGSDPHTSPHQERHRQGGTRALNA